MINSEFIRACLLKWAVPENRPDKSDCVSAEQICGLWFIMMIITDHCLLTVNLLLNSLINNLAFKIGEKKVLHYDYFDKNCYVCILFFVKRQKKRKEDNVIFAGFCIKQACSHISREYSL